MHDRNDRNEPFIFTRRMDGAWRVVVREPELEHVHREGFRDRREAFRLADEVALGLEHDLDLNLVHWDSKPVS